jgi:hypothetical protein
MGMELLSFVMSDPKTEVESVFGNGSGEGHVSMSLDS